MEDNQSRVLSEGKFSCAVMFFQDIIIGIGLLCLTYTYLSQETIM